MNVKLTPSKLIGRVSAPSSKSFSHRALIAAALAGGVSEISNISPSADIDATAGALTALGAKVFREGNAYTVIGIKTPAANAVIDCRESGSTMRFLIPIAAAFGCSCEFRGSGRLPQRPITPYIRELGRNGAVINKTEGVMPFTMNGKLRGGDYLLEGDISSQFISGLLFALPLCSESSVIRLSSRLESKPYVDMTVQTLSSFGISIDESEENGLPVYRVRGGQRYRHAELTVEGDYSQAAFYFAANALGSEVTVDNLNEQSVQGDKAILDIIKDISGGNRLKAFTADVSDIPDLVPILAVLGCFTDEVSRIVGAKRLRIKESDRLAAVADALNALGGKVSVKEDSLEIQPTEHFHGGTVNGANDHRIVMAAAIASTMAEGTVTVTDAEAVEKSYPDFWTDFVSLGGKAEFER